MVPSIIKRKREKKKEIISDQVNISKPITYERMDRK